MTAHGLELHLYLPQMRMSHEAIVQRAQAAEDVGFDGIAFMDHLAPPLSLESDMWEAMAVAGWVLAKTTTLVASHLVLCDALRHPAVLARQVTSLDHASGGRFELGIGWGSMAAELASFDAGPVDAPARVGRLAESLDIMKGLWTGDVVEHQGEHFTLTGAQQRPVPTRPIPITIGGVGRRTMELVRRHADWWNVPIHSLERLEEMRDARGSARVSVQLMVSLLADESEREAKTELARRRFGGSAIFERMVIGTAGQLNEHFAHLHASGIDRVYVWFADFAPVETLERFSPVVRAFRNP